MGLVNKLSLILNNLGLKQLIDIINPSLIYKDPIPLIDQMPSSSYTTAPTATRTSPLLANSTKSPQSTSRIQLTPRLLALICSTLTSITCSTPYIYSVYAPQLASQCHFTPEEAAKLSILLSLGSTFGGFPAGIFIDKVGPGVASFLGSICGFVSFGMLWHGFIYSKHSMVWFGCALPLSSFASIACFFASIKCVTANFPRHRGTAGAFPVSGYALGSLWYSWIANAVFGGNTSGLLLFVAFCGLVCCGGGSLGLRIHHHEHNSGADTSSTGSPGSTSSNSSTSANAVSTTQATVGLHRSDSVSSQLLDVFNTRRRSFTKYALSYWGVNRSPSMESLPDFKRSVLPVLGRPTPAVPTTKSIIINQATNGKGHMTKLGTLSSSLSQSRMNNYTQHKFSSGVNSPNALMIDDEEVLDFFSVSNSSSSTDQPEYATTTISATAAATAAVAAPLQESVPSTSSTPLLKKNQEEYVAVEDTAIFVRPSDPLFPEALSSSIFSLRFFKHYVIVSLLIASGQFYIYNIGFVVVTLVQSYALPVALPSEIQEQIRYAQSLQVSLIAIFSFTGRLTSGPISDLISRKYKLQRLWGIIFGSIVISIGHFLIACVATVKQLSVPSTLIGLAFGFVFGTYPAIIADEFGTGQFTTVWGLVTTGGIFVLSMGNFVFARELEGKGNKEGVCLMGAYCFQNTFYGFAGLGLATIFIVSFVIWHTYRLKKQIVAIVR